VRFLRAAVVLFALSLAPAAAQAPSLIADPEEPAPNLPPAGRSLFDELFEVGPPAAARPEARYALPHPFEQLLAELNSRPAPLEVTTVLVPLGRSLQRHAAAPDYFASPRVLVAVTEDGGARDRPLLKDRLYLGYHEHAGVIEIISYNEAAGRFEFQVVEEYGAGLTPRVEYGERFICVACHQGHGPIFPTAVWNETNADPEVAARLAGLGESYRGAPTRGGVDRADAFDRSTDRAARLTFANAVWAHGCGEAGEPDAARCRGDLLLAVLRYRLGGARGSWISKHSPGTELADRLASRLARIASGGLAAPSPDLPNRDPLAEIEAGAAADDAVDPDGIFEPTLARAPLLFWSPAQTPTELLASAVRDLAALFADGDIVWLDQQLGALSPPEVADLVRARIPCATRTVGRGGEDREVRVDCTGEAAVGRIALSGHVRLAGDGPVAGLVRSLALQGRAPVHRLDVVGGFARRDSPAPTLVLPVREAALGLTARLASGERLAPLVLRLSADAAGEIELAAVDDLVPLRTAVARMVEAAEADESAALGAGPLRRRAVFAELAAALDGD
jgi:hypothetical protein